ncbi:MAG: hypothetical protein ACFFDT_26895, partial [Candidatus Hodarchaeota archaeon]
WNEFKFQCILERIIVYEIHQAKILLIQRILYEKKEVNYSMSKVEQSIEKNLVIQGVIVDDPVNISYGSESGFARFNSRYILELKTEVFATFKRSEPVKLSAGERILVRIREECYIRKGDEVTVVEARMNKLKHKVANVGELKIPDSIFLESSMLYNETLDFSFNF